MIKYFQFIDDLHRVIADRHPTWVSGPSFYRHDVRRFGSANHDVPFCDWTISEEEGSFVSAKNKACGLTQYANGATTWGIQHIGTCRITAANEDDLFGILSAISNAVNNQWVTGSHNVVANMGDGGAFKFFQPQSADNGIQLQAEIDIEVTYDLDPIQNAHTLTTLTQARLEVSGTNSVSGSLNNASLFYTGSLT